MGQSSCKGRKEQTNAELGSQFSDWREKKMPRQMEKQILRWEKWGERDDHKFLTAMKMKC